MPGVSGESDQKPAGKSQADIPDASGNKGKPGTMKVGAGGKEVLYVQTYFLNVRSGPGMEYEVIDSIKKGEAVTVLEESLGWVKMGEKRYVGRKHLGAMKPQ
jgi:uncharacterized protein YgiM (DUF1202 family)